MRHVLKVFKALSDETRIRVLNVIMRQECSVCEVVQALEIPHSRASRSLGILYDAGLLKVKRDGLWVLYSIDEEIMKKSNSHLTEYITSVLKGNEIAKSDLERLKGAVREGPCTERMRFPKQSKKSSNSKK